MSGHPVLPAEQITLPLLPLRDVVVFPHMVIPLFVGRPKSHQGARSRDGSRAPDHAGGAEGRRQGRAHAPTTCSRSAASPRILQMLKLPDGTVKVLVEGMQRANTHSISDNGEHFVADVTPVPPEVEHEAARSRRCAAR